MKTTFKYCSYILSYITSNPDFEEIYTNNKRALQKFVFASLMEDKELLNQKDANPQELYDDVFKKNRWICSIFAPLVTYSDSGEIDDDKLYLKVREYSYRVYPDDKEKEYEAFVKKYNLDTKRYALINEHTCPMEVEIK